VLDPNGREWLPIETFVGSADELEGELTKLVRGKPIFIDAIAPNGDFLHLGVGGPAAAIAFATREMLREGRVIGPAGTVSDEIPEWVEFEAGGTPTPISRDDLVRADDLLAITKYFFETGGLHPDFTWE
jgi:hypothetical protein